MTDDEVKAAARAQVARWKDAGWQLTPAALAELARIAAQAPRDQPGHLTITKGHPTRPRPCVVKQDNPRRWYWSAALNHGELSVGARLTYAALASYANGDGECTPSVTTLAKRLGFLSRSGEARDNPGRTSVRRWLDELEKAGAVARDAGQRSQVTAYRLLWWDSQTAPRREVEGQMALLEVAEEGGAPRTTGGAPCTTQVVHQDPTGGAPRTTKQTNNKPIEQTREHKPSRDVSNALEIVIPEVLPMAPAGAELVRPDDDHFRAFWAVYPRHVARGRAEAAYRTALKRDGPDVIATGTAAWAAYYRDEGTEERFIPHPKTFLTEARYLDQPPAARSNEPKGWAATRAYAARRGIQLS